jgi:osmoprotectant transport system permease protein
VAAGAGVVIAFLSNPMFASIGGAIEFIFTPQTSNVTGGKSVGGIDQVIELTVNQIELSVLALLLSLVVGLPIGLFLGHKGVGELFATAIANAGRAVPELALIALMATAIGVGLFNLTIALAVLGVPPILANTFVGIHQVDRASVEAARGIGMTEFEILRKVEIPLAIPTIFAGIRGAAVAIVATATIAPLAGVLTLGDFIINRNVYGDEGVLAGAIMVALLALAFEFSLAGLQRLLTSQGLKLRSA